MQTVFAGSLHRFLVTGVGVARDAGAGIVGQHAFQSDAYLRRSIGDDDLTSVQRVADSYPAAVVK